MPIIAYNGVRYAATSDNASLEEITRVLAESGRVPIYAAGATAADQMVTAAELSGNPASSTNPLYVYRGDLDSLQVHRGSGWRVLSSRAGGAAYAAAAGTVTITHTTQGTSATVNFPTGRFTMAPVVTATSVTDSDAIITTRNVTASSCTINSKRVAGTGTTGSNACYWVAVQMTPTSGAG